MGFIPGFTFLSPAPERLHHPRLATPRAKVPAGSVGIANWQTGIYGLESPGGWQIIGRTPLSIFDAWDTPALECALGGLHVRFNKDYTIALSGAQMWSQNQGMNLPLNKAVKVDAGDILTMSFTRAGCRSYLAIAGGIEAQSFLGSVSTYLPAKLGGLDGEALKTGDEIKIGEPQGDPQSLPKGHIPHLSNHIVLRAEQGPEWDALSDASKRYLFTTPFFATNATDRMGSRLKGDQLSLGTVLKMTGIARAVMREPCKSFRLTSGSWARLRPVRLSAFAAVSRMKLKPFYEAANNFVSAIPNG